MDFRFSPEDEAFRQEVRDFVRLELPAEWEGGGRYPEEDGALAPAHNRKGERWQLKHIF